MLLSWWKSQVPSPAGVLGASAHTYIPGTLEVEAGGSEAEGHPWLHTEFKASLAYVTVLGEEEEEEGGDGGGEEEVCMY